MRWRLRTVYDRQEIYDVLEHLSQEGVLVKTSSSSDDGFPVQIHAANEDEESKIHWFVDERRVWYG